MSIYLTSALLTDTRVLKSQSVTIRKRRVNQQQQIYCEHKLCFSGQVTMTYLSTGGNAPRVLRTFFAVSATFLRFTCFNLTASSRQITMQYALYEARLICIAARVLHVNTTGSLGSISLYTLDNISFFTFIRMRRSDFYCIRATIWQTKHACFKLDVNYSAYLVFHFR